MNSIIESILNYYHYDQTWSDEQKIFFYKSGDNQIVSYFFTFYVDCNAISKDEKLVSDALNELERRFISDNNEGLRDFIMNGLDKDEKPQIDKNTSAIYLVKFPDDYVISDYKNIIYSIEESPKYFKRYIIPYTEKQINSLKKVLIDHKDLSIVDILNDLSNNEDDYYMLLNRKNKNSLYELVIRLFSKLPFLQYRFNAKATGSSSLDQIINETIDEDLIELDKAIRAGEMEVDNLVKILGITISDEEVNREIEGMLRE